MDTRTRHRRALTVAGAVVTALALTACGSGADEVSSSGTSSSSGSSTTGTSSPSSSSKDRSGHEKRSAPEELVAWPQEKPVPHLFFHSLVVDPERAFDGDERAQGYDDYMVTVTEFTRILKGLQERGYVLVDPHDIARVGEDGQMHRRTLKLPQGKKPLVLSVDDVSYYEYMEDDGFPDRLVVDDDGRVRSHYVDADGREHTGAYDVMPIVDDFVRKHPDFSHDGAKGVLAMTGYEGVFGYRTSPSEQPGAHLSEQRAQAKKVASALKRQGWSFASHTWGHINTTEDGVGIIRADQERWATEVQPIVGDTDMLIYPFGADIGGPRPYSGPVYEYLHGEGYDYFFGVDGTGPWQQVERGYLRQARINVDGILLRQNRSGKLDSLEPFMDVDTVWDDART